MRINAKHLNIHLHAAPPFMAGAVLKSLIEPPAGAALNSLTLPRIGEVWDEQRGVFLGVMPGAQGERDYALIRPIHKGADLGLRAWGERGKDVPGANSNTDGLANTTAMAVAGNGLAKDVLEMEVDGMSGLYIPARHEARMGYLFAPDRFDKSRWTWTSTQHSANVAWMQVFDGGNQYTNFKVDEFAVSLVRRLVL